MAALLSLTPSTLETYLRDAKRDEKAEQKARAWELWLDCFSEREISGEIDVPQKTVNDWLSEKRKNPDFAHPPGRKHGTDKNDDGYWGAVQHFDIWQFPKSDGNGSYFGRMPPQVAQNLLWYCTEPGDIVVDPFASSGTTIDLPRRCAAG